MIIEIIIEKEDKKKKKEELDSKIEDFKYKIRRHESWWANYVKHIPHIHLDLKNE